MAITHTVSITVIDDDLKRSTLSGGTVSGEEGITISKPIAAAQTDLLIPVAFSASGLQSIMLVSDQDVTIKTNSSGSPANTFSITKDVPFVWQRQSGITNPVTTDVTKFYATNTLALTLRGRILSL